MKANIVKFEKIYGDQGDAIFRFCLLRVSNRDQALDITQEAFLRLWRCMEEGQDITNSRAFLFTLTKRLIIDWYRKKKPMSLEKFIRSNGDEENQYDLPDENSSPGQEAEARFLIERLNSLPPNFRDPVYLRLVEDLSPAEIGELLGISPNAAGVRVNRGLKEFRKLIGYDEDAQK